MAQITKVSSKTDTKCPSEKIYNFFKYNMSKISNLNPQMMKRSECIEGEEGQVGNVQFYEYVIGKTMTVKLKVIKIDEEEKSVTWEAIEGELLQVLPGLKGTVIVGEGFVEWTFEYEKASESAPNIAEQYSKFASEVTKGLDAYLLAH